MKNIETIFETFVAIVFHFRTSFSCIGQFLSINSLGVFFVCLFVGFFFLLSRHFVLVGQQHSLRTKQAGW